MVDNIQCTCSKEIVAGVLPKPVLDFLESTSLLE